MGASSRRKGVAGEREFARLWERAGWTVRGLEAAGDLWLERDGLTLHAEVKRQERPQIPLWVRQCERECAEGVPFVLGWRASRQPWQAAMRLRDFLAVESGDALAGLLEAGTARSFYVGEGVYVRMPLAALMGALP